MTTYPTLATLRHGQATPGKRVLVTRRLGRLFVVLDLDEQSWPPPPFTDGTAELMDPMARHLAGLYVHRRDSAAAISSWDCTGYLYAPVRATDALLRVVWDVDGGRLDTARIAAPIIESAYLAVLDRTGVKARHAAARSVVPELEDQLNAALL